MPPVDWQTVAVVAVVTGAIVYIARAIRGTFQTRRSSTGCGTCGSCPSNAATSPVTSRPIVPLEALQPPPRG